LKGQERLNESILDLALDMGHVLGYIEDVEQFVKVEQLKDAMEEVRPLMEDTAKFIVKYTSRGGIRGAFPADLI
jgi:hypothetical protein